MANILLYVIIITIVLGLIFKGKSKNYPWKEKENDDVRTE